jgi:hypothetical protein
MRLRRMTRVALALLVFVAAGATPAAPADCVLDACVRCELKPNGQWVCKIVFQNAYCDCDSSGGGGCSQERSCQMIP